MASTNRPIDHKYIIECIDDNDACHDNIARNDRDSDSETTTNSLLNMNCTCNRNDMHQIAHRSSHRKTMACTMATTRHCIFVIFVLIVLPMLANGQISIFSTRDPRYYNREGDFHYRWPNPGDPDYR